MPPTHGCELLVLRHAKSSWDSDASSDHDRPLAPRGRRAAASMGDFLANARRVPDIALSSTAVRARTTAEILLDRLSGAGHLAPQLQTHRELYGASTLGWIQLVAEVLSGSAEGVRTLIAGHEPTCSGVVAALSGARVRFPTGAVAIIRVPRAELLESAVTSGAPIGTLEAFIIPRLL